VSDAVSNADVLVKNEAQKVVEKAGKLGIPVTDKFSTTGDTPIKNKEQEQGLEKDWPDMFTSATSETKDSAAKSPVEDPFLQSITATSLGMNSNKVGAKTAKVKSDYESASSDKIENIRADVQILQKEQAFHHIIQIPKPPQGHRLTGQKPIAKTFEKEVVIIILSLSIGQISYCCEILLYCL